MLTQYMRGKTGEFSKQKGHVLVEDLSFFEVAKLTKFPRQELKQKCKLVVIETNEFLP